MDANMKDIYQTWGKSKLATQKFKPSFFWQPQKKEKDRCSDLRQKVEHHRVSKIPFSVRSTEGLAFLAILFSKELPLIGVLSGLIRGGEKVSPLFAHSFPAGFPI